MKLGKEIPTVVVVHGVAASGTSSSVGQQTLERESVARRTTIPKRQRTHRTGPFPYQIQQLVIQIPDFISDTLTDQLPPGFHQSLTARNSFAITISAITIHNLRIKTDR